MMTSYDKQQDNRLDFETVGITNPPECWVELLDDSQRLYPGRDWIDFDQNLITVLNDLTELPVEFIDLLSQTLEAVTEDHNLNRLAWLWHYFLFIRQEGGSGSWPLPNSLPQHLKVMFPAVIVLSGIPQFLEIHECLAIPEAITRNCLTDIGIWADDFRNAHGHWGFSQTGWLQQTLIGRLFRLHRLQFMHTEYSGIYNVYRNRNENHVIALAGDGMRYRLDGKVDGTNGIIDENAWTATLESTSEAVKGYVISSDGRAVNELITLKLDEWEQLLGNGMGVLDVHIPAGAKMDYDECVESYRLANEFFPKHFPEQKFTGYICTSWLLDPNLQNILPNEANIVRFQKEFYLIPVLSSDNQTFERVFGSKPKDLATVPRDTSLRRAVLDYVLAGNYMHQGFGFMPCDEVGREHRYYKDKD